MIRRLLFAVLAALAAVAPASAQLSTSANRELSNALTDDGYFGIPRYTTALLPPCTTTPARGKVAWDTTATLFKVCNGTAWASVGGVSAGDNVAWTGTHSFIDGNFSLIGSADATKIAKFEVDTNIPTGTTRTYTFPSYTGTQTFLVTGQAANAQAFVGAFTSEAASGANAGGYWLGAYNNTNNALVWGNLETPDTGLLLTGTTGNSWVVKEAQDIAGDCAHAAQTNPTVFVHSATTCSTSTTQWTGISHDGTSGQVTTGTGGVRFPAGSASAPGVAIAANDGIYSRAATTLDFTIGGTAEIEIQATGIISDSNNQIGWSATTIGNSNDAFFMRDGPASVQLGQDINGAATAQMLKAQDGIAGTDIAGSSFTNAGGRGTGAGAPGDYKVQTATPLVTGTTAQVLTDRLWVEGGLRTLTDAAATAVFTVTTGNDVSCGGTMFFCVEAADATNQQTTCGEVHFAAADNAAGAGGEACGGAVSGTNATAATSGTLTVTATVTDGGTDVCNVNLTATGSLTETVGPRVRYSIVLNPTSSSTCAITPQ